MSDLDSTGLSQLNLSEANMSAVASSELFGLLAAMGDAAYNGLSERPYERDCKPRKNSCPGWPHPAIKEIQQLGQSRLSGNEATSKPSNSLGSIYKQEYTGKLEYTWVTYAPEYWANANRRQESPMLR